MPTETTQRNGVRLKVHESDGACIGELLGREEAGGEIALAVVGDLRDREPVIHLEQASLSLKTYHAIVVLIYEWRMQYLRGELMAIDRERTASTPAGPETPTDEQGGCDGAALQAPESV